MKKFSSGVILVLIFGFCPLVSISRAELPDDKLIQALIQVESSGNDNEIGDVHRKNKAYGCLQVRQLVCDDVNRHYGMNYQAEDMLGNRALSIEVCRLYVGIYARVERLGHEPTAEDVARIWNGGPKGWRKHCTLAYWEKVRKVLDE